MKISVIIPTYNRANLIKSAIKDLLKQTYKKFEIIVVDDCSTDNTKDEILSIKDTRVKYFRNETNMGASLSEQNGLSKCSGEFVTFLADDDKYIDDTFFEEVAKNIEQNDDIDIISAKYETVINNKIVKNDFFSQKDILDSNESMEIFTQFACGGNSVFRKSLFKQIISYQFEHDFSMIFLMLLRAKKIKFINKVVFYWYLDLESDTFSSKLLANPYDLSKWDLKFLDEIIPILKQENLYEKYKWFIEKRVFEIFENVSFNYYLSNKEKYFNNILNKIDNEVYIYGYGQVGNLLKEFLIQNDIKVLGFIDDYKSDCLKTDEIDKSKQIIIATFKQSLIHKIYKNLIKANIPYEKIKELI